MVAWDLWLASEVEAVLGDRSLKLGGLHYRQLVSEVNCILGHPFGVRYLTGEMASPVQCRTRPCFKTVGIRPAVTCQVPVYHHKDERVWSWVTSIAQGALNLSILLRLLCLKISLIHVAVTHHQPSRSLGFETSEENTSEGKGTWPLLCS